MTLKKYVIKVSLMVIAIAFLIVMGGVYGMGAYTPEGVNEFLYLFTFIALCLGNSFSIATILDAEMKVADVYLPTFFMIVSLIALAKGVLGYGILAGLFAIYIFTDQVLQKIRKLEPI